MLARLVGITIGRLWQRLGVRPRLAICLLVWLLLKITRLADTRSILWALIRRIRGRRKGPCRRRPRRYWHWWH